MNRLHDSWLTEVICSTINKHSLVWNYTKYDYTGNRICRRQVHYNCNFQLISLDTFMVVIRLVVCRYNWFYFFHEQSQISRRDNSLPAKNQFHVSKRRCYHRGAERLYSYEKIFLNIFATVYNVYSMSFPLLLYLI